MLNTKYLGKLRQNLHAYASQRMEVINKSNEALHHAKRAIFALHRDNVVEAKEKLEQAEGILSGLHKTYQKDNKMMHEGAFLAALEEYVEAKLFFDFVTSGKIGEIKIFAVDGEVYLAGLCDVPGELYRFAIKAATEHDIKTVKKCNGMAQEIIGELIEFNLTSYLRTKFDQAKQSAHRLEQVVYEVSLRE
ncbi:MAG: hypothetical protein HZC26_01595 [Candidatus Magasanikbacteria bacterium]|nr:hypothetical protein [Candidatus Magasanikbacteria bacterium]MBI5222568.1 hypothetical protein [Candidatus Magasanikbacteria bacterium]